MLSNAYFLAKFRFDTAENEPVKNLQKFCKHFAKIANLSKQVELPEPVARPQSRGLGRPQSQDALGGRARLPRSDMAAWAVGTEMKR